MTSENITEIVKEYFNVDFTIKSREINIIYMRSLNNVLCREFTDESLSKIGKNYESSDHATVLHSIRKFKDTYINLKDPVNLENAYNELRAILTKNKEYNVISEPNYKEVINELIVENEKLNMLVKKQEEERDNLIVDAKFKAILSDLKDMSYSDISDFHETRLKPFKKALESRIKPKVIKEVAGALILR